MTSAIVWNSASAPGWILRVECQTRSTADLQSPDHTQVELGCFVSQVKKESCSSCSHLVDTSYRMGTTDIFLVNFRNNLTPRHVLLYIVRNEGSFDATRDPR